VPAWLAISMAVFGRATVRCAVRERHAAESDPPS
jgi:hypothetical protein